MDDSCGNIENHFELMQTLFSVIVQTVGTICARKRVREVLGLQ